MYEGNFLVIDAEVESFFQELHVQWCGGEAGISIPPEDAGRCAFASIDVQATPFEVCCEFFHLSHHVIGVTCKNCEVVRVGQCTADLSEVRVREASVLVAPTAAMQPAHQGFNKHQE